MVNNSTDEADSSLFTTKQLDRLLDVLKDKGIVNDEDIEKIQGLR